MAAFSDDCIPSSQTDSSIDSSNRSARPPQGVLSQFQGDWVDRLNLDEMYVLIDGVLPFEACLYYQVLPLFLDGNRLNLGMVSPEDTTAANYVRRIISYLNYSLVVRRITADALQSTLTAYLNAAENKQKPDQSQPDRVSFGHHRHIGRNRVVRPIDQTERLTLVVDSPDELEEPPAAAAECVEPPASVRLQPSVIALSQPTPLDETPAWQMPSPSAIPEESPISENSSTETAPASFQHPVLPLLPKLPVLQIEAKHLSAPAEELMTLPPPMILQELLARVLVGGIGRLYFENHTHSGRILWSQNGVLQSVLENVPIALFHDVLTALKQTANLESLEEYPKQVEAEYLYIYNSQHHNQQGSHVLGSRVLLRFRFMLNAGHEEATLQILRGAALKFHQQQQMRKLERDAMGIAKQLQIKLSEIRDRTLESGEVTSRRFDVLPGLSDLLRGIEQQLDELGISESDPL
jgi:hypothetical protein